MFNQILFQVVRAKTSAEGAKNGYICLVAAVVPFALPIILALGVGELFAGFEGLPGCARRDGSPSPSLGEH